MNKADDSLWTAVGLFVGTAFFFVRSFSNKRSNRILDSLHDAHHPSSSQHGQRRSPAQLGDVGLRGQTALTPAIPYLGNFLKCLDNPCHPTDNPQGYIPLAVAENKLVLDLLAGRFMSPSSLSAFSDSSVYTYNAFQGSPVAREALSYFLARRFYKPNTNVTPEQALEWIPPERLVLSSGCAACLNHLFFLLGDPDGQACLIPAPYYAAFENDMNLVAGIVPCRLQQANPARGPTVLELEFGYTQTRAKGLEPKFLLLCNPNNPLGTVYPPEVLRDAVQWARSHGMHVICDEIYALSDFATSADQPFQSIIQVLDNDLGNDVHFVWALSKDFGASGLRVGVVYSQNDILLQGMATANIFSCISGPVQYLVAEMLTDDVFCDAFLQESRHRLQASYAICTRKLEEMVLPYIPAVAGLFVYVDFSSLLPQKTYEWERKLSDLFFQYARVVLTPGESQRDDRPGMFRICFSWVAPEVLEIAMERLSRLVAKVRRLDWDDLNDRSLASILA